MTTPHLNKCEQCPLCHKPGNILYENLRDVVFGVDGDWRLRQCVDLNCKLVWLDPCISQDAIHLAYSNYYTHNITFDSKSGYSYRLRSSFLTFLRQSYLYHHLGYVSTTPKFSKWLLDLIVCLLPGGKDSFSAESMFTSTPSEGRRLLEIGCGDGRSLSTMRALGWSVEAVEFDRICVENLRNSGIKCYSGDIRSIGLTSNSYDLIFMGHVIEHVFDPLSFFEDCFRILRPGGSIVLLTPNSESWGAQKFSRDWRGWEVPRHIQVFNLRNLSQLLSHVGFTVETARTTNRGGWYIIGASAEIRRSRKCGVAYDPSRIRKMSLSGIIRQYWSQLLLVYRPNLGEELLFTAIKNAK